MLINSETFGVTSTRYLVRANAFGAICSQGDRPASEWAARFKCRLHPLRSELRFQVNNQVRFSGKSFTQVWRNTGHIVGSSAVLRLSPTTTNVSVAQLCSDRIARLLASSTRLPDSYNKLLIRASGQYCQVVVPKLREERPEHQELLSEIRRFISQEQDLISQYSTETQALALLDLQLFDDKFLRIQNAADRLGLLGRLNNLPISALVRP